MGSRSINWLRCENWLRNYNFIGWQTLASWSSILDFFCWYKLIRPLLAAYLFYPKYYHVLLIISITVWVRFIYYNNCDLLVSGSWALPPGLYCFGVLVIAIAISEPNSGRPLLPSAATSDLRKNIHGPQAPGGTCW